MNINELRLFIMQALKEADSTVVIRISLLEPDMVEIHFSSGKVFLVTLKELGA